MNLTKSFSILALAGAFSWPSVALGASPKYIALADSANRYMKNGHWLKAEAIIIEALRTEPANFTNSVLFSNLGLARTEQGKYKDALEAYDLGLSIDSTSTRLYNNRARTLMLMENYQMACADLDRSLSIDSIQEWPLQMRGLLRISNNKLPEAEHDLLLLAKHFHKNDKAFSGLARIAEKKGKYADAEKYYDEAIAINDDPETRSARILLKINAGKYSEAAQDLRKSLEKYPQHSDFYIWRGYLHKLNFRNEEAEADKRTAINKGADPHFVEQFIPKNGR